MGLIGKVSTRLRRDAGVGVERTYLYACECGAVESARPLDPALALGLVPACDIESLATLGFADPDEWRERLARGDRCHGAWIGHELVHYSWVQTTGHHPIGAAGIEVSVRPGDVWIYNCRTADLHRGKRIYPATLRAIATDYAGAVARTAWIYTSSANTASQRGITRVGFVQRATLRALRLGRRFRPLSTQHLPPS